MHVVYHEFNRKSRLKFLEDKQVKFFHKAIVNYLKNIDIALMQLLKEENFIDFVIKKDVTWACSYDTKNFYYSLTYIFFEDHEEMNGSERNNDYTILLAIKKPMLLNPIVIDYEVRVDSEDMILKEFKSMEEFKKSLLLYNEPKKILNKYIFRHNNKIELIKNDNYLQALINKVDNEIMVFLNKNNLNNYLFRKILDYNLPLDKEQKKYFYCATYVLNEPLRLQESYTGNASVYNAYTLYDESYDVHKNTYSFQIKIIDKRVYFRIIPNENKRFKLLSERLNEDTKEILNIESKKFIAMMKDRVD